MALLLLLALPGMENVRSQFETRAAELMERMLTLGSKQEEMLEAQGQLGSELATVGGKVSEVSEQVGFSNHAILLLCGALSEMAKRVGISNGKYVRELEHLSRTVATTGLPAGITAVPLPPAVVSGGCSWRKHTSCTAQHMAVRFGPQLLVPGLTAFYHAVLVSNSTGNTLNSGPIGYADQSMQHTHVTPT